MVKNRKRKKNAIKVKCPKKGVGVVERASSPVEVENNEVSSEDDEQDDLARESDPQPSVSTKSPKQLTGSLRGPLNQRRKLHARQRYQSGGNDTGIQAQNKAKHFHSLKQDLLGSVFTKLAIRALVNTVNNYFQSTEDIVEE